MLVVRGTSSRRLRLCNRFCRTGGIRPQLISADCSLSLLVVLLPLVKQRVGKLKL